MTDIQEPSQSEPLPIWYWLFMLPGAALIVMVSWGIQRKGGQDAWWLGTLALLGYVSLSGIVWRVTDWLRHVAMPSVFLSAGFIDTLRQRVFWAVGPQFFGMLFLSLAAVFVPVHWARPPKPNPATATQAPTVPAVVPPVAPVATRPSSPVSATVHAPEAEAGSASAAAESRSGLGRWHCDHPAVLTLVREEVWAAAAMRIKTTHGVDLSVDELSRMLDLGLQDMRENESDSPTYTLCSATFNQHAHVEAVQLGLETQSDADLVYWIEQDAFGNLQVGVGD